VINIEISRRLGPEVALESQSHQGTFEVLPSGSPPFFPFLIELGLRSPTTTWPFPLRSHHLPPFMTSTLLYRQLPSMMSTFNQGPSFLHQKRAHSPPPSSSSFSTRDANDSSSSDSDTPPPPRKRRTTATSSEEEGKPSLFAFQPPAARSSRRGKRAHDSEVDDDRIGEDEEDISLENQAQESSPSSGTNWRSSAAAFPPNPKRIKRSLAEHLTSLGISEGAAAAAGGRRGSEEEEEVLHPYTVEQPEEVGPGVWLGSAPASQEDEVEISGVGEDEEERARNEMAVGFWRGNGERQVPSRGEFDPSSASYDPALSQRDR